MHVTAIIAAAGAGRRLGTAKPKQLLDIGGGIDAAAQRARRFSSHPRISDVIVVMPPGRVARRWRRRPA